MTEQVEQVDLAALGAPYWSPRHAAEVLGGEASLEGALVLTTRDGMPVLPVCQFRSTESGVEMRPGLPEFIAAMARVGDGWTTMAHLHVPGLVKHEGQAYSVLEASKAGVPAGVLDAVGARLAGDLTRP